MNEKLPTPPADGYQLTEAEVIGAVFDAGPEGVKLIDKWGVTAEWFTIPNGRQMLEVVRDVIGQGGRRDDSDMPDTLRQTAKRLFPKEKNCARAIVAPILHHATNATPRQALAELPRLLERLQEAWAERRRAALVVDAMKAEAAGDKGRADALHGEIAALAVNAGPGGRGRLRTRNVGEVEERPIVWLWPGRIECGAMTVFNGFPGAGKSMLTLHIAACVTTGRPFPDGAKYETPGRVLLLTEESESIDKTIKTRLVGAGADCSKVEVVDCIVQEDGREDCFTLRDTDALEGRAAAMRDLRLIVIDPAGSYIGGDTDAGQDNKVRAVLRPVLKLVERLEVALIVVTHSRKNGAGRADDLILGSRAFSGMARCIWHIGKDADAPERVLFLPGKISNARRPYGLAYRIAERDGRPYLEWEPEPVAMSADEAFTQSGGAAPVGRPPDALNKAKKFLADKLTGRDAPSAEIERDAAAAGIAPATLNRAKADMKIISTKSGAAWYWGLPSA